MNFTPHLCGLRENYACPCLSCESFLFRETYRRLAPDVTSLRRLLFKVNPANDE